MNQDSKYVSQQLTHCIRQPISLSINCIQWKGQEKRNEKPRGTNQKPRGTALNAKRNRTKSQEKQN